MFKVFLLLHQEHDVSKVHALSPRAQRYVGSSPSHLSVHLPEFPLLVAPDCLQCGPVGFLLPVIERTVSYNFKKNRDSLDGCSLHSLDLPSLGLKLLFLRIVRLSSEALQIFSEEQNQDVSLHYLQLILL